MGYMHSSNVSLRQEKIIFISQKSLLFMTSSCFSAEAVLSLKGLGLLVYLSILVALYRVVFHQSGNAPLCLILSP